ncbi:MAG: prohibitin family protein [Acidimicrobiales bacterium]
MARFWVGLALVVVSAVVLLASRRGGGARAVPIRPGATSVPEWAERLPRPRANAGVGAVLLVIGLGLVASSFVRIVPANTIGIPTILGKVGKPLPAGFHLTVPWTEITEFSTRTQELSMLRAPDEGDLAKNDSVTVIAQGGGSMAVDITVRFSLAADQADELFKLAGSIELVKDRFVRPDAREVTRNVFGTYTAEEGYSSKRAEISAAIGAELATRLRPRGVLIDSVNVRDVGPEQQVLDAINSVLQTRNEAARATEDQIKQVTEAETRKQVAALDKEATITKAEADGEAVRIAAQAQADANAKVASSLTPALVELEIAKACADAIARSGATVINVCAATGAGTTTGAASSVIVDGRAAPAGTVTTG